MNQETLNYVMDLQNEHNSPTSKRNRIIIIFCILLTLFIAIIILTITEGFMKREEIEEYAITVENANITTVLGPLMFTGSTYTFIGTCFISFATIFIKNMNLTVKKMLKLSPIFVILFTLPAVLCAFYIVQWLKLV